ncbi:MAG: winged helix DNA-binding domain-containing protein, partial [Verrucomicrobiota bacterium]
RRMQQLELDDSIIARCEKILVKALQGGRELARTQVYELLEKEGISCENQRGYHILWQLAQQRLLCFGAHAGKQPTFVLLDEWVPAALPMERDEALATLARRYFTSHGPATLSDYVWWSGLKVSDARAGLEAAREKLFSEKIGKEIHWMQNAPSVSAESVSDLHLLPPFDEYLLGYKERSAVLDSRHAREVTPGNNGVFMPTILQDSRIVGTWKRTPGKNGLKIATNRFDSVSTIPTDSLIAAIERYARFAGLPVDPLTW